MDTWSSVPALVDRESTLAGWQSVWRSHNDNFQMNSEGTLHKEVVTCLVLGHERRGGAVGDHEPGVEAAVLDEEGWQLAVRGVAQPLDPPLAALGNIQ